MSVNRDEQPKPFPGCRSSMVSPNPGQPFPGSRSSMTSQYQGQLIQGSKSSITSPNESQPFPGNRSSMISPTPGQPFPGNRSAAPADGYHSVMSPNNYRCISANERLNIPYQATSKPMHSMPTCKLLFNW